MQVFLGFILSLFLPFVYCDSIKVNSPALNQVFTNSSFLVDFLVQRNNENNGLFLTNTTTQLLDSNGNVLVAVPRDTTDLMVRLNMITFVKENTVTNFTIKIIGLGKYNQSVNGKLVDEIEQEVPLQLNLNASQPSTNQTSSRTSTRMSTRTSTQMPTRTSSILATTSPSNTPSSNGNKSILSLNICLLVQALLMILYVN